MRQFLTEIFDRLKSEQQGPAIAALVAAIAAVIAAVVAGIAAVGAAVINIFATWNAARKTAKATQEAAEIAAIVKRESETLSRLLVPLVTPSMIDAMKSLWVETSKFARSQTPPTDINSRKEFVRNLSVWYYKDGNGLFLSPETRDALFRVRCCALRPDEAKAAQFDDLNYERWGRKQPIQSDHELAESLRAQVSELRSALKRQLGIYGVWSDQQAAEGSKPTPRKPAPTSWPFGSKADV